MVLDLSIARLRQIIAAITLRHRAAYREQAQLVEWQTRHLAQFTALTAEGGEKLAKQALKLTVFGDGEADAEGEAPGADDPEVYVEQGSQTAAKTNKVGSYEALTRGMRGAHG